VFALNSPYYLDTTEINKLSAYFGLYSKTEPHLEVAVRTLFGEMSPQGAAPVSVDGVGYDLASALAPDPDRPFPLQVETAPGTLTPPITAALRAGPVLDHNGNPVPDGTPVEFKVTYRDGQAVTVPLTDTVKGVAEANIALSHPGAVTITATSGEAQSETARTLTIATLPTTATASPTATPTVPPVQASSTPLPPTNTPVATVTATPPVTGSERIVEGGGGKDVLMTTRSSVAPIDLLLALGIILLTAAAVSGWSRLSGSARPARLALVTFIGGMVAYLLFGIGWLRPDLWLNAQAPLLVQRLTLAALVLFFGLGANWGERLLRR